MLSSSDSSGELDQAIFEFAVGRDKQVPPHVRQLLINSQPTVKKLKQSVEALLAADRLRVRDELLAALRLKVEQRVIVVGRTRTMPPKPIYEDWRAIPLDQVTAAIDTVFGKTDSK